MDPNNLAFERRELLHGGQTQYRIWMERNSGTLENLFKKGGIHDSL
jgi:hypothetical protein